MKQIAINPNNRKYFSEDFIKGFKCGAERQLKADKADRPQGEWIGGDVPTRCSICGHYWDEYVEGREIWYEGSVPNFCPNCGARMKGADE